jgi:hypothetical protein
MPFFVVAFSAVEQREAIATALKSLQSSTRMIQSHCAQSKASRAVGALAQLPHVKKQLELLVFNVKHMLAEHECGAAFWMGNLKHKTAAGVPVSSQVEPVAARSKPAPGTARRGRKPKAAAGTPADGEAMDDLDEDDVGLNGSAEEDSDEEGDDVMDDGEGEEEEDEEDEEP